MAEPSASWAAVDVESWALSHRDDLDEEPLGTKEKFWVAGPDGREYLFKFARQHDGVTKGEDWAEWLAHHLARMLGVPTASVMPATCGGRRGILSRSLLSQGERLIHGNELLARVDPDYDSAEPRQNPGYTVPAVAAALRGIGADPRFEGSVIQTAFDQWAGYLVLDAWVAGRDRHHENWAAIDRGGVLTLAPSYDHGNALGFQETAEKAARVARDPDLLWRWARHGRSHHFAGKPELVTLARSALEHAGPGVERYWLSRLATIQVKDVVQLVSAVPAEFMSDLERSFRAQLLEVNRERIRDGG